MAKSAQDTKLEDVLSSVRRLVSDELPRNERPTLPDGPGALVLTDAHRIEPNASVRIAGRTLEERIAELEMPVGDTANDDEFEPDGSEDQSEHRPDRIVYTRPPEPEESEDVRRNTLRLSQIALIDTGPANDDPEEGEEVQLQFRRETPAPVEEIVDEAPMAEDVKETLTAAEVHIFTSPDDEVDRIEARLNGEPEPEKSPEVKAEEPIVLPLDAMKSVDVEPLEDERLEEIVEDTADAGKEVDAEEVMPAVSEAAAPKEGTEDFDEELRLAVSSVDDVQDTIAADAAPEPAAEAEQAIAEAAIGASVAEVLNEEDLQPIVAKLIRQELQGELGERITRNVRKLVRREILRALAARDAE
jgi:hypothetical protein